MVFTIFFFISLERENPHSVRLFPLASVCEERRLTYYEITYLVYILCSLLTAKEKSEDPLCFLSPDERYRICNIVLTASYFDEELVFSRSHDSSGCSKLKISFRDNYETKSEVEGMHYEEWMIRCTLIKYVSSYQFEYFLSQAYEPNEVFVYRWEDGRDSKIFIENLFNNVRIRLRTNYVAEPDTSTSTSSSRDGGKKRKIEDIESSVPTDQIVSK